MVSLSAALSGPNARRTTPIHLSSPNDNWTTELKGLVSTALSAATDCNAQIMACETTFKAAVNASKDDVTSSCKAGATFLSCLDTKDNDPVCSASKPVIAGLRQTYASQISQAGCTNVGPAGSGPLQCSKDIQACQQQFVVDDTKAGSDNTLACQAGEKLANCLTTLQGKSECGGAQKVIDSIRSQYHQQINTQGCASILRPAQTQCQKDVVACQQTFQTAVAAAPNNAIAQCNAGTVFMACLDKYDRKIECLSAQSAISSMRAIFSKQIAGAGCGTGAAPTVTACQGDVLGCVKTFTDAIKIAGNNVDKQCSAGATLTSCLDTKNNAPECAAVKGTIASLKATFASQIRQDGCAGNVDPNNAKVKCSLDVTDCEETFQVAVTDSGTDIKATCVAGSQLELCLTQVENNADCSSSKSAVKTMKDTYTQQIDQTACASQAAENCAQGVLDCSNTYHTKIQTQTSDDALCKVANTYITCLNGVTCSASFKTQLSTARLMVQQDLANVTKPCDLAQITGNAGGTASGLTASITTFLASLMLVLYAMVH